MGSTPQSIQSLLHTATPDITDLLGRARFLQRIRQSLLEVLPVEAGPHVYVAAYDHYRLRLHVSHGSWATRLRYMEPAIAQALAQRMRLHIESVDVKVRSTGLDFARPARARRVLSSNSREHIRRVAAYTRDAALAEALTRLAEAGREPSS